MDRKFKVGDKIIFDETAISPIVGAVNQKDTDLKKFINKVCEVTAIRIDKEDNPRIDIKINGDYRPDSYEWRWKKFDGKIPKPIPIELHIVLKNDSTTIISGVKNSYKEAEESVKKLLDDNDIYTIYKLVPIAKIQNTIKVAKVKQ